MTRLGPTGMATTIKQIWYPVHLPDAGYTTDFVILAGDPINGEFVGCYRDLGTAYYHATLHNNHISGDPVLREVDLMFQSEISFELTGAWDGGIDWYLRDKHEVHGNEATIEEALAAMTNAARRAYPESCFAHGYASDVHAVEASPGLDAMAAAFAAKHGSFTLSFDADQNYVRPDDAPWTLTLDRPTGAAFAGFTAQDAIAYATDAIQSESR